MSVRRRVWEVRTVSGPTQILKLEKALNVDEVREIFPLLEGCQLFPFSKRKKRAGVPAQ